jgi:hypothetical protein
MAIRHFARHYAQRRLIARAGRSLPWIGIALAAVAVASAVRRKGLLNGALDTVFNSVPIVGAMKNTAEVVRGRDFFPDRRPSHT